ncbi:hypothetical protein SGFS_005580 [Streptomyces graminofaciens]|uniref:Acyl-CoA dehydrogenase n=1 Tax=Streptomyces graminofaciens TaxID=68212 RepID=A0ABM7F149_9ACTN|nr:hypothetical protein SGFS_005580 [Streptomyces graminofaciens]
MTDPELIAAARELIPLLRANAERTERDGNPVPENIRALREAGLFRLTKPAEFGGLELGLPTLVEIISEVGRGCPSTGWILANDAASADFAWQVNEQARAYMFKDDPDTLVLSTNSLSGSTARKTDDGTLISGRFPWSSGCEISEWVVFLGVPVFDEEQNLVAAVNAVAPTSDVTIERTWQVSGMSGTGTQTIVVEDLFIPEYRTVTNAIADLLRDEDQRPSDVTAGSLLSLSSVVGAARGALDVVTEALTRKKRPISTTPYESVTDSPVMRMRYAEAKHLVDSAVLHMRHAAERLDGRAHDEPTPWVERAEIRMHMASALQHARQGVEKLLDVNGASSFRLSDPLQRYWRDLAIGSRHTALNQPIILEDYSLALWGVRPSVTWIT